MPEHHKVPVVRIQEIKIHPNADRLEIIPILGYQVVSGKGQFKVGDLAVYVPPDSVVPEYPYWQFVWEKDGGGNPRAVAEGESVPERWRRVTVRRLRKEWSEGLLMPISITHDLNSGLNLEEGDDCAERLGIYHYNPPEDDTPDDCEKGPSRKQSKKWPRGWRGWWYLIRRVLTFGKYEDVSAGGNETAPENTPPIYDVAALKHYKSVFQEGDQVIITEKIHGSNARYTYRDGHMYAGSRRLWKKETSKNIWRRVLELNSNIEAWCREFPEYTLFGEVVPTQGGYDYGATSDQPKFFMFDIRTPDGQWLQHHEAISMLKSYAILTVPFLYEGAFSEKNVAAWVDGPTFAGGRHIREGIVIKATPERDDVYHLGRAQLKLVSNLFLDKEKV